MLTASKLAKFLAKRDKEMFEFLRRHVRDDDAPVPEPAPFKPEPVPQYESEMERMLRCARNDIAAGRAVSSNMLRPKPKPPTRPDQQRRQSNRYWGWWR